MRGTNALSTSFCGPFCKQMECCLRQPWTIFYNANFLLFPPFDTRRVSHRHWVPRPPLFFFFFSFLFLKCIVWGQHALSTSVCVGRFGKKKMEMFASGRHEPFSIYQNFLVWFLPPPGDTHRVSNRHWSRFFLCSGKLASLGGGGGILVAVNLDRWSESISAVKLLKVLVC